MGKMPDAMDDWEWWWGAWRGLIRCPTCRALTSTEVACSVCNFDPLDFKPTEMQINGQVVRMPVAFQGPLDWSPYAMLKLMHREWLRPVEDTASFRTSSRAFVVIMFWTYFEALMTWYFEAATDPLPRPVATDLLNRYNSIGARLDRLHKILFSVRYRDDLDKLGFGNLWEHLETLQKKRNEFIHGNPEALDDATVFATAREIPAFHKAWIATFNRRCTAQQRMSR